MTYILLLLEISLSKLTGIRNNSDLTEISYCSIKLF